MKVGHYQCACETGDYGANIKKVLKGLDYADRENVEIMTFPESFLTGYFKTKKGAWNHSFELEGAEIRDFLKKTRKYKCMFMVGFNERRGDRLFNTVLVAEKGKIVGTYSKAFPCVKYFTPGREFPVFSKNGVKFGVVICADGGYVEPCRILALKGARIIFAPHYNIINKKFLLQHFTFVRSDHTARAIENGVWFMRCNNVTLNPATESFKGIGYGDSYLVDPNGEIILRSQRHEECFLSIDIDVKGFEYQHKRSVKGGKELGALLMETLAQTPDVKDHFC